MTQDEYQKNQFFYCHAPICIGIFWYKIARDFKSIRYLNAVLCNF